MNPLDRLDANFEPSVNEEWTFSGFIREYFNTMAAENSWDISTQVQYIYRFNRIMRILCSKHNPPISSYTEEDYKNVVSEFRKKKTNRGMPHTDPDINQYMYLLYIVDKMAEKKIKGYESRLWGSSFSAAGKARQASETLTYNFRSFSPEQEVAIFHKLTDSPETMSGEDWGLFNEYALGCRNNESVAMLFYHAMQSNIVPVIWLYESESARTGEIVSSTKTPNGNRGLFPPQVYQRNIAKRFNTVVQHVSTHLAEYQMRVSQLPPKERAFLPELYPDTVKDFCLFLPVACKGSDYLVPTTSRNLTDAGKKLFRSIDFDEETFFLASVLSDEEEFENNIKVHDPSTYCFRRNFFTHAYICLQAVLPGLIKLHPIAALELIVGHKIDFDSFSRRMLRDETVQRAISQALSARPLLNDISVNTITLSSGDSLIAHQLLHNEEILINGKPGDKIIAQFENNEPSDKTKLNFSMTPYTAAKVEQYTWSQSTPYTHAVNVLKEYQAAYINAENKYQQKMAHEAEARDNDK